MERLPYEVRLEVLNLLTHQDQFTCLFVSKQWNGFIKPCLFKKVTVGNDQNFKSAITFFEKHSEMANQVLQFEIKSCEYALWYMPRIQKLFPKLKKLDCSSNKEVQLKNPPEDAYISGIWENLEELTTSEEFTESNTAMVEQALSSQCLNLTKLSIRIVDARGHKNRLTHVLYQLKNVPRLSRLEISTYTHLNLDLENLHENAPKLNSLTVSGLKSIIPIKLTGPFKAVQLVELSFQFGNLPDDITFTFDHIIKKYVGLTSFSVTFYSRLLVFEDFPANELERITMPLFARCPKLKCYDQSFFPLTPSILNEMDRCGIQLEVLKMYIGCDNAEQQCRALTNSNQSSYINTLFLALQDPDDDDVEDEELQIIKQALESLDLKNLKNLTFYAIKDHRICLTALNGFLNTMPQLLEMAVHDFTVLPNAHITNISTKLPLRSILIHNVSVKTPEDCLTVTKTMRKLLQRCPVLEKFVLNMYLFPNVNREIKLDFRKNPKLKSIVINLALQENKFSVITRNTTVYYWYDYEKKKLTEIESLTPWDYYTTILLSQPVLLNSRRV